MYSDHKGNCVKPSPEPSPVEDLLQPPSFPAKNNTNIDTVFSNNYENIPLSSEIHHNNYGENSFVQNPSVMLSESDETCKNTYFRQNVPSEDSSYKLMPSFNLVDDSGNHFDMTYVQ